MPSPPTMSSIRSTWRRCATALALVLFAAADLHAASTALERLLAASDPFAAAPAAMRARLVFSTAGSKARVPLELWRKGDDLALIRFLAEKDRGKFVVRRDGAFFFLTPTAARPVKLAPALAPAGGAALDDLLSLRPSRGYTIAATREQAGLVTFDLLAKSGTTSAPRVRWVVDRARQLPVRAEFRDRDDRVFRLIEFKRWKSAAQLEPEEIVAKDLGRGGLPLTVEFLELEAADVPDALFALDDDAARAALPWPDLGLRAAAPP